MHKFIGIRIGQAFLDLDPDMNLTLELSSGIFNLDEIEGNFTFPFNIPFTDKNAELLKHSERIENSEDTSVPYDCELWLGGRFGFSGYLKILPFDGLMYSAYFINGQGSLKEVLSSDRLRGLFGDVPTVSAGDTESTAQNGVRVLYPSADAYPTIGMKIDWAFGIYTFSGNSRRSGFYEIAQQINDHPVLFITAKLVTIDGVMGIDLLFEGGTSYTIILDLWPNATQGPLTSSVNVVDFDHTVDYTNKIAFPSIFYIDFYEGKNPAFQYVMNAYVNGKLMYENEFFNTNLSLEDGVYTLRRAGEIVASWQFALSPQVYNRYVLQTIFDKAGVRLGGAFVEDAELNTLLIFNNRSIDKLEYSEADGMAYNSNVHETDISLPLHLPDMSVNEYLASLRKCFGLAVVWSFDRRNCHLLFLRDIVESADYDDWTAKVANPDEIGMQEVWDGMEFSFADDNADMTLRDWVPDVIALNRLVEPDVETLDDLFALSGMEVGDIRYVLQENCYFVYKDIRAASPAWRRLGFRKSPYKFQGAGVKVETAINPITAIQLSKRRIMPWVDYKGTSPIFDQTNDGFGFRLMFNRGLKADENGENYVMAAVNRFGNNGVIDPSYSYDLQWDKSEAGLFETFWRSYATMLKYTRAMTIRVKLDFHELSTLDLTKKKRIGNMNYLIDRLRIRIGSEGLETVEANLQSVRKIKEADE